MTEGYSDEEIAAGGKPLPFPESRAGQLAVGVKLALTVQRLRDERDEARRVARSLAGCLVEGDDGARFESDEAVVTALAYPEPKP